MGSKGDYLEDAVINSALRGVAWPVSGANVYVGLLVGYVSETSLGTEVAGGSYARVAVSRGTGSWDAPANDSGSQKTANTNAITFASPTANWGTVDGWGIWDASTSGNLLYHAALTVPRSIQNGDQSPTFAAGALTIAEG